MKKKALLVMISILLIGANVFGAGDLIVTGKAVLGEGDQPVSLKNQGNGVFAVENLAGSVVFKMENYKASNPVVFEMKYDQAVGGHLDTIPGGMFDYWLFSESNRNPAFKVCGYPAAASSNQCVSLSIEGADNDLNMSTEGLASDILLMPQANVGIGITTPAEKLEVAGNIYATGTVTWGSSRELKKDIRALSAEEAITTLNELDPKKYYYKADSKDEHIGFIAEDVPELLATKDRKSLDPMDIVGVLTKVVQEQQRTIVRLTREVNELKER